MNFWPALSNTVVITTLCVIGQVISLQPRRFRLCAVPLSRAIDAVHDHALHDDAAGAGDDDSGLRPVPIAGHDRHVLAADHSRVAGVARSSSSCSASSSAQIPEELIEAARIDGASNWRIYWQLMLPLCGPVIAIVAIYTFLGAWNDFLGPLIYLNSPGKPHARAGAQRFRGQYGISDAHLLMAASVVCMLPCIICFCAQQYFVESVAMTGMKS